MSDAEPARAEDLALEWLSLDEGERVEWAGHPARVSMVPGIVWGVVLLPLFGLGLLVLLGSVLRVRNTDYVVTNQSLYVKKGILSTTIESVGLDKIQNTEYRQSFLGKQFGYGSIDVSTAGSGGTDLSFGAIEDARSVRETITRLSAEYAAGGGRDDGAESPAGVDDPMGELLAELTATREALERAERALRERAETDESGEASNESGEASSESDASEELNEEAFSFDESVASDDGSTPGDDSTPEGDSTAVGDEAPDHPRDDE
ncbi:MAG: PH domain-containing protein [Haloferacaceae archaeon]